MTPQIPVTLPMVVRTVRAFVRLNARPTNVDRHQDLWHARANDRRDWNVYAANVVNVVGLLKDRMNVLMSALSVMLVGRTAISPAVMRSIAKLPKGTPAMRINQVAASPALRSARGT